MWLVQDVLRPSMAADSVARWALGPAPNIIVGFCFVFAGMVWRHETPAAARRAISVAAVLTLLLLIVFEIWRPIRGARTFDPLDIAGSIVGVAMGWIAGRRLAPRWIESDADRPPAG